MKKLPVKTHIFWCVKVGWKLHYKARILDLGIG